MKKNFLILVTIGALALNACSNNSKAPEDHSGASIKKDSLQPADTNEKNIKVVTVAYPHIDAAAATSLNEIVNHYLHIKNALTNDDGSEAANGGRAMEQAMHKMDKSLLSADQRKVYDDIAEDLEEHAEHIGKNGDNVKHQREHFSMMSQDVYDLVKAFGAGKALYEDRCPMYNEGKGAIWLSEMKEIKNPYYGSKMITCGNVEQVIR